MKFTGLLSTLREFSPNSILITLNPTLFVVFLYIDILRSFHNGKTLVQLKNTCCIVSISSLQKVQQSFAMILIFFSDNR